MLPTLPNPNFNAQHSPMGGFLSFTVGHLGSLGGLAAERGRPADQEIYIGIKHAARLEHAPLQCLPFFPSNDAPTVGAADYLVEQSQSGQKPAPELLVYAQNQVRRQYGWATDRWTTDDFTFTIYTPFGPIPDPASAGTEQMRTALAPSVIAELEVDNRSGTTTTTAFFAIKFRGNGWYPLAPNHPTRRGFAIRPDIGVLAEIISEQPAAAPELFCRWSPADGIHQQVPHLLGNCPGLAMEVPPGQRRVLRLALGCYLPGIVTSGIEGRYLYTRYFSTLDDVLHTALDSDPRPVAEKLDRQLLDSGLSADQQFLIAHATRSYYGSTQLLDVAGEPFWVVNEGEYRMLNTLDLCVDHMFWELDQNPWVVRNLLDNFVRRYSYVDDLKSPHSPAIRPGGISFTHDMGANNVFSDPGHSSYELPELNALCFSYMTAEQLCNWILMAATYVNSGLDVEWARRNAHVFNACLESLERRGGNSGIPEFDSSRCGKNGAEITTYDSLDHSLAATRQNLYMAVKFWASAVGLEMLFDSLKDPAQAARALSFAKKSEQTILAQATPDGTLPAVFDKASPGYHSRILPAVEGLLYPHEWGYMLEREFPQLFDLLKRHTRTLLTDPQRRNLFDDGGIRLSSTSNNSWMSKIAIFQKIARDIFHLHYDPAIASLMKNADAAHVKWQIEGGAYWACSDQIVSGIARGSKYYPRIITTALWLAKNPPATPTRPA